MPYSRSDIGGFKGNPSAELYIRWFQMATFLPFCRTHSANNVKHRTPWSFGEPTLSIVRDLLKFRDRLCPYFYTLAWQTSQTGYPVVRPVFWTDPEDPELWDVEDAFLLGDALLVCPIVDQKAETRDIRLPQGHWYHFWTDALEAGTQAIKLHAGLNQVPLLVKAGSLLPMREDQQLVLHLYPSVEGKCAGEVYSDTGDGYGEGRIDRFSLTRTGSGFELIRQQQGSYPFPYKGFRIYLHGIKLHQVWSDDTEIGCENNCFDINDFDRIYLLIREPVDTTKTASPLS